MDFFNIIASSGNQTLIIFLIFAFLAREYKQQISTVLLWLATRNSLTVTKLLLHDFFTQMEHNVSHRIDTIVFHDTNPIRNEIVRHFLKIKYEEYVFFFRDFIKNKKIEKIPVQELQRVLNAGIIETRRKYDKRAYDEGIPQIFIDRYNEYRKSVAEDFLKHIELIAKTQIYGNNIITMTRILDKLSDVFERVLLDAEHTIANINGDLTPLTYKGQVIGDGEKKNYLY